MEALLHPKPEIRKRKDRRRLSREWQGAVYKMDGRPDKCIIPPGVCVCHLFDFGNRILGRHHILPKGRYPEYKYDPRVGMTIGAGCHWAVHNGVRIKGIWIPAGDFMLRILDALKDTPAWRWDFALKVLTEGDCHERE